MYLGKSINKIYDVMCFSEKMIRLTISLKNDFFSKYK